MTGPDPGLRVRVLPQSGDVLCIEVLGEADIATHTQLKSALAQVCLEGNGPVRLSLTEMTFCDVHAFRHLVAFAAMVRGQRRGFSTNGASRTVRLMSSVLDTDSLLNMG